MKPTCSTLYYEKIKLLSKLNYYDSQDMILICEQAIIIELL